MVDDFDVLMALGFTVTRSADRKKSPFGHMPGTRAVRLLGDERTPDAGSVEIKQGPRRGVRWRVRVRLSRDNRYVRPLHLLGFTGQQDEGEAYTAMEAAAATQQVAAHCHQQFLRFNRNR